MELTRRFVLISAVLMAGLVISAGSSPTPLVPHLNSQLDQNGNQLVADLPVQQQPQQSQSPLLQTFYSKVTPQNMEKNQQESVPTKADYDSIFAPATPKVQGSAENHRNGQVAVVPSGSTSSPSSFFSLSRFGDFGLSTYLVPYFWHVSLPLLSLILLVVLTRHFFPAATLGNLVSGIRGGGVSSSSPLFSARSLDLDRMTNAVYDGLSSYGKWATSTLTQFSFDTDDAHSKSD